MPLKEKIDADLKAAMKNADAFRVGVLRLLKSALQNETIAKHGADGSLSEEEVLAVLKREAKKRKESISVYTDSGRGDLAETEVKELELIGEYLPPEIGREEIEKTVKEVVASGATEFSAVMKEAMARFKGAADGKVVSEVVRSILG